MRWILTVALLGCAACVRAQAIDYAAENARFSFVETAPGRALVRDLDRARDSVDRGRQDLRTLIASLDSLAAVAPVQDVVPLAVAWMGRLSPAVDSALGAVVARARPLHDSTRALELLRVRRAAASVDSVRGVVTVTLFPRQNIAGVRTRDSLSRIVQFDAPHAAGDTIFVYAVPFGRSVFLSRDPAKGWEMTEGAPPPVGPDSVFDVLREVARPRVYALYDDAAARWAAQMQAQRPGVESAVAALVETLRAEGDTLDARADTLDRRIADARRRLWLQNMTCDANAHANAGDDTAAVARLERALHIDSVYAPAIGALQRVRAHLDSTTRLAAFGPEGMRGMVALPAGEVTLATGERFRPDVFLIDSLPVSRRLFDLFERATGYVARAAWRLDLPVDDQPVRDLAAEDRVAFARWAGKRPASPQEFEYARAGGWPTLAESRDRAQPDNPYGVVLDDRGLSCVRDLFTLDVDRRPAARADAEARAVVARRRRDARP